MAECLTNNRNHRAFGKEYKKMNGSSRETPPHMDGSTGPECIAQQLSAKHSTLYNSVPSDFDELNSIKQKIKHAICRYNGSLHIIAVEEMKKAISKLHGENSDGDGQLLSNHIIYAPDELSVHLSVLMTCIILHGYNPTDLLLGTLISQPKDKHGNICDSDNYKGICLCSCITNLLEW